MAPDPAFIEPLYLAGRKQRLDGFLPLNAMERLREIICEDSGTIEYHLQLGRDDMEIPYIKGNFKVTLKLICQRCLNPFDLYMYTDVNIGLAMSETEIERLPGQYEPMLLTADQISLLTLIEDEVLLGVPMVPLHDSESCPTAGIKEEYKPGKESPFAALKDLVAKNSKIDTGEK
jgi:uncharacterized protein